MSKKLLGVGILKSSLLCASDGSSKRRDEDDV
jgi:hypothetical protein